MHTKWLIARGIHTLVVLAMHSIIPLLVLASSSSCNFISVMHNQYLVREQRILPPKMQRMSDVPQTLGIPT